MDHVNSRVRKAYPLDIPFNSEEKARFRAFLKATGRKAGPWVRTLALHAMDEAEARGDGSIQTHNLAAALQGMGAPSRMEEAHQ
jgi:hypothetical protein